MSFAREATQVSAIQRCRNNLGKENSKPVRGSRSCRLRDISVNYKPASPAAKILAVEWHFLKYRRGLGVVLSLRRYVFTLREVGRRVEIASATCSLATLSHFSLQVGEKLLMGRRIARAGIWHQVTAQVDYHSISNSTENPSCTGLSVRY